MAKNVVSIKAAARDAKFQDARERKAQQLPDGSGVKGVTLDSFTNYQHKLGVGTDNPLSSSSYGFNPVTRIRTLLEWIYRGSWIGGQAVDIIADDMTREGVEFLGDLDPEEGQQLHAEATALGVWTSLNENIRWGRLYGGSLAVALIDGQDFRTPLRMDSVAEDQFKGLIVLDRWMVNPSLEDLVTDLGPHLGMPKYYRVQDNAPALRGKLIHYSRVMHRHGGIKLPYQQALMENLWGISVLERLYDRMIAFDSASTGVAQLVYKSYLRTLSIDGLRDIVGAGGPAMDGLIRYQQMMTRFQGIEGMSLIDAKDKLEAQTHNAFSGLGDALDKLGEQLSGALSIPLVRLFGQAPGGLNSDGESNLRTYYDHIKQKQTTDMYGGVTNCYRMIAASKSIKLPENFGVAFRSLWQMTDKEKADVAKINSDLVTGVYDSGIIGRKTALKELQQQSRVTGAFTNIDDTMIDEADDEVAPPAGELVGMPNGEGLPAQGQEGTEPVAANANGRSEVQPASSGGG